MLMLHGMLSSNAQWDLNRDALGREFRLLMVELPGHGRSPAYDEPADYSPSHVIAELELIRVEAGIDRWWVCGQSLGGAIAIRYCLAHPEHVFGLIFTNSRAAFGVSRSAQLTPDRSGNGNDATPPGPKVTRDLPMHPANATRLPQPLKDRMIDAADAVQMQTFFDFASRMHEWQSVGDFAQLQVPVLLVNGRWEKRFQPCIPEARSAIARLDVVDIEGGHAINAEKSDDFNAAVLDFVSRSSEAHRT
ncbi:2-succinyl-6-hydroxy-2,4-cyclohexadiene-1-carboxylate synthase [Antricoccus suffuscus]|uniref:2-succinyl-6-hydroxy-2, 4-cyclohexadiene-1-carboxylate synthase n=1 Tax=Antricoccus suffuscus TaxID=1629062 RepID=A0A2T1A696_9ACTN|nr:alpha/beta hydrolase [Antricoccus suffuscus]PRZ44135.1 2-succinyl-6-hydroxy-2,4-cyclohexadiene-1-carboxylate synthase [Antricoccus suffuscus]